VTRPPDPSATPVLDGVRALVTGGTGGLGFAMSQALAEAGARVALTGRTEQRVQDAAARIGRGAGVTGLVMDVRDERSVSAGVDRALAVLGGVDVLVNNAGIGMCTVNPDFITDPAGFWQVSPGRLPRPVRHQCPGLLPGRASRRAAHAPGRARQDRQHLGQ
jgi:NAD(P)-dependent dehydrogenase (short-subunit alcohol dehydrogenase family)